MISGEPFELAGRRLAFTNWFYVRPCAFAWVDEAGVNMSVRGDLGPLQARFQRTDDPFGVRMKVHPAQRSGPILSAERPWEEGGIALGTVLKDQDIYRAWGSTGWGDLSGVSPRQGRGRNFFVYFESADGIHWHRPDCGIISVEGRSSNNILGIQGGAVFIDPSASEDERYKWIAEHHFSDSEFKGYQARYPQEIDLRSIRTDAGIYVGVQGAISPDGLHWQVLPEPLGMFHSDTQVVAYYDPVIRKIVGYFREWMVGQQAEAAHDPTPGRWIGVGRRAIGRAETEDFRHFPLPDIILAPHPGLRPSQVFYTNCRTSLPGAPDAHLMFPTVWDQALDTTEIHFASSNDGRSWNFVTENVLLETAPFGEWDGGCVFASPDLIELPNGDFALPYTGYNVPHKYPRGQAQRATGYALWPKGRLVGIEAEERGAFSTAAVLAPGSRLRVNALIRRAGSLRVEAARLSGEPINGREFENSIPLFGDCHGELIHWKEHDDLGVEAGEAVLLRFRLEAGNVYYVDFE
jgi:hypothetical protein